MGGEFLKTSKKDKKEYKVHLDKIQQFPKVYQLVYQKITKFVGQFATDDGMDMVHLNQNSINFLKKIQLLTDQFWS